MLLSKNTKGVRGGIIAMTYLTATALNTLAIYVHFSWGAVMRNFLRITVIPFFVPIIAFATKFIYERLEIRKTNIDVIDKN